MNYYSFHIGDYARKTRHLSWDEDMAYRRLIDAYYTLEAPLHADRKQVYRLISVQSAKQRAATDAVLKEFFEETPDGFRHSRCDDEIYAAAQKRGKASQSAHRRWENAKAGNTAVRTQSEDNANASANGLRTQSEGNAPNPNPNPNPNLSSSSSATDPFEEVDAALRKIPGLDNHPVATNAVIAPIWQLVQQGYDLRRQIIPSISRQLANRTPSKPIKGWTYFVNGIVEDSIASKPNGAGHVNGLATDEKWNSRLEIARRLKQWDVKNYGPFPNTPCCRVPPNLVKPGDGDGWTEWKAAS